MSLVYLIVCILILTLIWLIPTAVITFTIKKILKKKLSKGWCILIAAAAFFVGIICETTLIGVNTPGILDTNIRFACLSIIFTILYDKNIPSIFDTEKEIKRKRELQNNKDANA